jgi:hypothetical protein
MKRSRTRWGFQIQMGLAIALVLVVAFFALGWYEAVAELGRWIFPE